jgi:hypothetical protein
MRAPKRQFVACGFLLHFSNFSIYYPVFERPKSRPAHQNRGFLAVPTLSHQSGYRLTNQLEAGPKDGVHFDSVMC